MVHSQKRIRTKFRIQWICIVDYNVQVPAIRFYAVSTGNDRDTTIDLNKKK